MATKRKVKDDMRLKDYIFIPLNLRWSAERANILYDCLFINKRCDSGNTLATATEPNNEIEMKCTNNHATVKYECEEVGKTNRREVIYFIQTISKWQMIWCVALYQ